MKTLFQILVPRLSFVRGYCSNLTTIRQTCNGPVEGIEQTSLLGKKFYAFRGIPFAEPPITGVDPYTGQKVDRRFKAPEPLKRKWTKNLKVHNFADNCVAFTNFYQSQTKKSEDCLYLNVYVPAGGKQQKTVMVYIYGGGFTEGEATDLLYGPDFLLGEDNIVVLIQYRVGVVGFLNLGFGEYTGNMGLKDQQLGLKWVQDNIEYFSGNRDEILLLGDSAGAASVGFQMLNKESRKCFNRAYLLSGSAFSFFAFSEHNHLERMQDCMKTTNNNELIDRLRTANSKDLFDPNSVVVSKTFIPIWCPTVESPKTAGAFLTKSPEEIYESDEAPALDTMFSITSQEFISFYPNLVRDTEPYIKPGQKEESDLHLPFPDFNERIYPKEYKQALEMLRQAYFSNVCNVDAVKNANIGLLSDLNIRYGILKAIIHQTRVNNKDADTTKRKNTFLLRFSVNTEMNFIKLFNQIETTGSSHSEDVCYFLHCQLLDPFKLYEKNILSEQCKSDIAYVTHRRMVKMITNFARTGNPSIENDVQFESSKSPNELICHEITNDRNVSITTGILKQLHFDTWSEIEKMTRKLRK